MTLLNSYRSNGLSNVRYLLLTNDYGLTDTEAGGILSINDTTNTIGSILGSIIVDTIGVKKTAVWALSVALVARTMITFGTSTWILYIQVLFLGPLGDSLLSTGLYTVALKKLTTMQTRTIAFAIGYTIDNLAGAMSQASADYFRRNTYTIFGHQYTGLRVHLMGTLVALIMAWVLSVFYLKDLSVVEHPPEPEIQGRERTVSIDTSYEVMPTKDVPKDYQDPEGDDDDEKIDCTNCWTDVQQMARDPRCHRVALSSFCTFGVFMTWGFADSIFPAWGERHFGQDVPILSITSINFWMCVIAPPIIASLTSDVENLWNIILPGILIFGLAPIWVVIFPNSLWSGALWVITYSIGEVISAPTYSTWVASQAPLGREGLFLMVAQPSQWIPTDWMAALLNNAFNSNCPTCRDDDGFFCKSPFQCPSNTASKLCQSLVQSSFGCSTAADAVCAGQVCSQGTVCAPTLYGNVSSALQCATSCADCPGWENYSRSLWFSVLLITMSSPVLMFLFKNFLQGTNTLETGEADVMPLHGEDDDDDASVGVDVEMKAVAGLMPLPLPEDDGTSNYAPGTDRSSKTLE